MLKKILKIAGVTALMVAVVGVTAAFGGYGPRGGGDAYSANGDNGLIGLAAEVMDMERADLIDRLLAGETIADVADERGVDLDEIVEAFLAVRKERLDRAVDLGRMTEEDVEAMLDTIEARITEHLTGEWPHEAVRARARDNVGTGAGPARMERNGMMLHR